MIVRYLLFTLLGILYLYSTSVGQSTTKADPSLEKEINQIREVLNIPPEMPITFAPSKELPSKNTFKVYGLPISKPPMNDHQQATQSWVEKWNKKNAVKYGLLGAASDISQADLIFLWFISPTQPIPEITSQFGYNPIVIVRSYLIMQKPTGVEIVWKVKDIGADYNFAAALGKEFEKRMKARAKVLNK